MEFRRFPVRVFRQRLVIGSRFLVLRVQLKSNPTHASSGSSITISIIAEVSFSRSLSVQTRCAFSSPQPADNGLRLGRGRWARRLTPRRLGSIYRGIEGLFSHSRNKADPRVVSRMYVPHGPRRIVLVRRLAACLNEYRKSCRRVFPASFRC